LPNIWRAIDLVQARHGSTIQIAGTSFAVSVRHGKGFIFISLEDETGFPTQLSTQICSNASGW
jgi:hypothetical protein